MKNWICPRSHGQTTNVTYICALKPGLSESFWLKYPECCGNKRNHYFSTPCRHSAPGPMQGEYKWVTLNPKKQNQAK